MAEFRIGHGYDVHRLVTDRKLWLAGVEIPHTQGLLGHSDADVLAHAVADSILGALALGDIGSHFPDTDPLYKNADSMQLLRACFALATQRGYKLGNLDATILAEKPKLAPYIGTMRKNLANTLQTEIENISVKATTEEGLGFTGTKQGMAVHSVVLLTPCK